MKFKPGFLKTKTTQIYNFRPSNPEMWILANKPDSTATAVNCFNSATAKNNIGPI